jgi:predicted Zn-dependent peptidase
MMRTRSATLAALLAVGAVGCGGATPASYGPHKVELPATGGVKAAPTTQTTAATSAPPSGTSKESPFPAIERGSLANGMQVAVVTSRALPIVQLRVLVRAGSGFGATAGVATLTGDMLKDGGTRRMASAELLRKVETLGADLAVRTDFDATVLSMAVTKDQLPEALSLLSQVVREPRFDNDELKKLKARTTDEAESAARSSGQWTATRLVFRDLFPERSAYATYGLVPSEIAKVDGAQVREFHRRFYVPKSTTLVLAGDVDAGTARSLAERSFGSWAGGEPPRVEIAPARAPEKTRVIIAHRPKSVQSDVYVAMLAPARRGDGEDAKASEARWAAVRVANQVLGGGVASRLFTDVRERRSLAYRTNAQILELARGDQPLLVHAGTETAKTSQVVRGLLENLGRMTTSPPTADKSLTRHLRHVDPEKPALRGLFAFQNA